MLAGLAGLIGCGLGLKACAATGVIAGATSPIGLMVALSATPACFKAAAGVCTAGALATAGAARSLACCMGASVPFLGKGCSCARESQDLAFGKVEFHAPSGNHQCVYCPEGSRYDARGNNGFGVCECADETVFGWEDVYALGNTGRLEARTCLDRECPEGEVWDEKQKACLPEEVVILGPVELGACSRSRYHFSKSVSFDLAPTDLQGCRDGNSDLEWKRQSVFVGREGIDAHRVVRYRRKTGDTTIIGHRVEGRVCNGGDNPVWRSVYGLYSPYLRNGKKVCADETDGIPETLQNERNITLN